MNNAPQIIMLIVLSIELGMVISKHGQPRDDYNAWLTLASTIVIFALLAWGGFWNE